MAKFQSPLLGYNNNVRHKNRLFHLQTEDSGVNHPHIITHLFMDGGRILKSVKKSYAEHVGVDGMSEIVKQMMKEQHKAMFIALRDGQFDHLVDDAGGGAPAPAPAAAAVATAPAAAAVVAAAATTAAGDTTNAATTTPDPAATTADAAPPATSAAATNAVVAVVAAPLVPAPPTSEPKIVEAPPTNPETAELAPATIDESRRPPRDAPPSSRTDPKMMSVPSSKSPPIARADAEEVPTTTRQPRAPEEPAVAASALTLDFDALDQASRDNAAASASSLFHSHDLPPPPKNLFAKEVGTGKYSTVDGDQKETASKPASSEGRYAPSRPAAIFGSSANRPQQPQSSIFGDELLSDKSLDEVILSYLAEDLEPPRRK